MDRDVICNKCNSEIKPKKERKQNNKNYICNKCGFIINNNKLFKKHINDCYPKLLCPDCKKEFDISTNLITLKNHVDLCTDDYDNLMNEIELLFGDVYIKELARSTIVGNNINNK